MKERNSTWVKAAMAGLVGATMLAVPAHAKKAKSMEVEKCYGINGCKGQGSCGGKTAGASHECAGQNSCGGQGWLWVGKGACTKIKGGSLTPPEAAPAQ